MEIKRIEIELHQKTSKLIGKRMEQQSQKHRRRKTSKTTPTKETDDYSEETTSNNSNDSMDVPAITFKNIWKRPEVDTL